MGCRVVRFNLDSLLIGLYGFFVETWFSVNSAEVVIDSTVVRLKLYCFFIRVNSILKLARTHIINTKVKPFLLCSHNTHLTCLIYSKSPLMRYIKLCLLYLHFTLLRRIVNISKLTKHKTSIDNHCCIEIYLWSPLPIIIPPAPYLSMFMVTICLSDALLRIWIRFFRSRGITRRIILCFLV